MSTQAQLTGPRSPSANTNYTASFYMPASFHLASILLSQLPSSKFALITLCCASTSTCSPHKLSDTFCVPPHSSAQAAPQQLSYYTTSCFYSSVSLPSTRPCAAAPLYGCGSSSGADGSRAHPVRGQHINVRLLRRLQRSAFAAVRGQAAVIQQTEDSPSYAARAVAVIKLPPAARQPQSLARRSWPRRKYLHAGRQARLSSITLLVQREQVYTACGRCGQVARTDKQMCWPLLFSACMQRGYSRRYALTGRQRHCTACLAQCTAACTPKQPMKAISNK